MTAGVGGAPVHVFVAPNGNAFMRDIATWIAEAAALTGRDADVVEDGLPEVDGSINLVVAPHELFELHDAPVRDLQRAAAASVCVCTEQPETPWFHLSLDACRRGRLALDISPEGLDALRRHEVRAERLVLGAVPSMTAPASGPTPGPTTGPTTAPLTGADSSVADRSTDVLFMGGLDDRRARLLASLAPQLTQRRCDLRLFRFERPVTPSTPGLVFGREKYALLASAQVLLNLHRDRSMHLPPTAPQQRYFEWARMVEAMANGCVVVSEPSNGYEPLVPGVHFVEAEESELGDALESLLGDPARLQQIAGAAREAVTAELAMPARLGALLDRIETEVLPGLEEHVAADRPTTAVWRLGAMTRARPYVGLGPFRPYRHLQRSAKELALAESRSLRRLDSAECLLHHGAEQHIERVETPAYDGATPDVTVVVTLYDYADLVRETLDSILASEGVAFEVVVVEDHSHDESRAVVTAYLADHPDVAMVLLGKDANEGLAAARNTGFGHARAPLVMVVDADNHLYPHCLRRLADALAADPCAGAAYGILEDFGDQTGVRSALAWEPERLCRANYIDAQAMLRREVWASLGGYRDDDDHVFGWEDWDLWLRLAASGSHASLVREILGRYRVRAGSMIALTNLATDEALESLEQRYPTLPWPDVRP